MIDDNPNLLQLRALQTFADNGGNTLVLGVPQGTFVVGQRGEKNSRALRKNSGEKEES
jgi:hypothetical protein